MSRTYARTHVRATSIIEETLVGKNPGDLADFWPIIEVHQCFQFTYFAFNVLKTYSKYVKANMLNEMQSM